MVNDQTVNAGAFVLCDIVLHLRLGHQHRPVRAVLWTEDPLSLTCNFFSTYCVCVSLLCFCFLFGYSSTVYLCFHSFASINAYKTHNCPHIVPVVCLFNSFVASFCFIFRQCFTSSFILSLHACYFSVSVSVYFSFFHSKGFGLCVRVLFL